MNIFKKALIVALSAGLVVVPSTLDKVEEVEAASLSVGQVLYLKPNSNWQADNARFAIYTFGTAENWQSMTKVSNGDTVYRVVVNKANANLIFCRMSPSATANNWSNKWNQTADLTWSSGNMYTVASGTWDNGGGSWSTYKEFGYTLYLNDGTSATYGSAKNALVYGQDTTVTLASKSPTREGYNFLGWSTSADATEAEYQNTATFNVTSDVTLYAVWEEAAATDCKVTYIINGNEFSVTGTIGTSVEDNIPTTQITNSNYKVLAWDKTGELTGDTTVTATTYYKTIDQVKAELNFSYNYYSKLVIFQCPIGYNDGVPSLTATNSKTNETKTLDMNWCGDSEDGLKKEWYANVDVEYDKLTFNWKNGGTSQTYTCDRDFEKNAIWWDSASSNGTWAYDVETNNTVASGVQYQINRVSNMKLRVGTLALLASDFAGVDTYGIRIAKGSEFADDTFYGPTWSTEEVVKVDADGNADENGEYIRWNAVVNNIPEEYYTGSFTATAYVVIDGVTYDICTGGPRTVSVVDLASTYASTLSGVEQQSCQFIVDTYGA